MSERSSSTPASATAVVCCLGILIAYLPVVGVPVVLGDIAETTGAQTAELQWITSAGLLALAVSVLSAGVVGDIVGRKAVLLSGFALICVGALVGIMSGFPQGTAGLPWLYIGQACIGVGGGALLTSTLSLISQAATDHHQRTLFISLWASSLVVGSGLGPFISGAVTTTASWYWVFLPLTILAACMIPVSVILVPRAAPVPGRGFDIPGQITAALGVTALVFGIIEGPRAGWVSKQILVTFALAAVLIGAFLLVERSAAAPLVRLDLFKSPGFVVSAIAALVILFVIVGIAFILSLFFSGAQHLSVLEIATRIGVLYLFAAITGPVTAQLQRWIPASVPLVVGLAVAACGVFFLGATESSDGWIDFAWPLGIAGVGVGAVLSTVSSVAIHSAPLKDAGMAGSTNNLFRQIGAALGPSVIGTVLATQLSAGNDLITALHVCMTVMGTTLVVTAVVAGAVLLKRNRLNGSSPRPVEAAGPQVDLRPAG